MGSFNSVGPDPYPSKRKRAPAKRKKVRPIAQPKPKKVKVPGKPKAPVKKKVAKPYDPLASLYKTPADFEKAVASGTQNKLAPQLNDIASQRRQQDALHRGSLGEIGSVSDWYAGQLGKAFTNTQTGINSLIGNRADEGRKTLETLSAAIRASLSPQEALAGQVGTAAPQRPEVLTPAATVDQANQEGLNQTAQAMIAAAAARQGEAGAYRGYYGAQEGNRYGSALQELMSQTADVERTRGDVSSGVRQELGAAEAQKAETRQQLDLARKQFGEQKANRLFQQWLSKQELGLKERGQTFQEFLGKEELGLKKSELKHSQKMDWERLALDRDQLTATITAAQEEARTQAAGTTDKEAKKRLETKAKAVSNASDALVSYLTPGKDEGLPGQEPKRGKNSVRKGKNNVRVYRRSFDEAFRLLRKHGLSPRMSYKILSSVQFTSWRRRAKNALKYYGPGAVAGPGPGALENAEGPSS